MSLQQLLAVYKETAATDPYFGNVKVLLHLDGTNGSTAINDQISGHTWSCGGSTALTTTSPKFGTASVAINGGYVVATADSALVPGTNDFTYEGWGNANSWGNTGLFCTANSHMGFALGYYTGNSTWQVALANGSTAAISGTAPTTGTQFKWSVSRISGVIYLHIDGICLNPAGTACTSNDTSNIIVIGFYYNSGFPFDGKIDEFRFTNGVGRYNSSNYTPETVALPDS